MMRWSPWSSRDSGSGTRLYSSSRGRIFRRSCLLLVHDRVLRRERIRRGEQLRWVERPELVGLLLPILGFVRVMWQKMHGPNRESFRRATTFLPQLWRIMYASVERVLLEPLDSDRVSRLNRTLCLRTSSMGGDDVRWIARDVKGVRCPATQEQFLPFLTGHERGCGNGNSD